MWRLVWLLILLAPAPAQDELMLRWNRFANDANDYLQTIEVNPERRAQHKARLAKEWNEVYPLL